MERTLLRHAAQLVTPMGKNARHGADMAEVRIIEDAAVYAEDGIVVAVGPTDEVEPAALACHPDEPLIIIEAAGKCVLPGFVDSHTHFVFGGYRPTEFMGRLKGAAYMDSLKSGGGIQETVRATASADEEELLKNGLFRLRDMLSQGVTTVEGKSGYGLDEATERKQLIALRKLHNLQPVDVVPTYLGAHAVPPAWASDPDGYIDWMISTMLPLVQEQQLAEYCDVFCEDGVFSLAQSEKLLEAAKDAGFRLKLHADEIVPLGGGELAAKLGATSADHLLMVTDKGVGALAKSDTVATLLPCTAFCLHKPYAPARKLIDAGCAVALASDYNPGSCFTNSIPLMLALAVIHMGMSLPEALTALTLNGAAAVGRADSVGSLEPGKRADYCLLQYPDYQFLIYHTGKNIVERVVKNGRQVWDVRPQKGSLI